MRAHGAHDKGVAVGDSFGHHVAADVAARAGLVVDHHGLAQLGFLTEQTGQNVRGAARWEGDHQTYCFGGVGLSLCRRAGKRHPAKAADQASDPTGAGVAGD